MSYSKYVKGGALNHNWAIEEQEKYEVESLFNSRIFDIELSVLEFQMKLEATYNFIKTKRISQDVFIDMIRIIR